MNAFLRRTSTAIRRNETSIFIFLFIFFLFDYICVVNWQNKKILIVVASVIPLKWNVTFMCVDGICVWFRMSNLAQDDGVVSKEAIKSLDQIEDIDGILYVFTRLTNGSDMNQRWSLCYAIVHLFDRIQTTCRLFLPLS